MVDFPERAHLSFRFLDKEETELAVARIQSDRGDVQPAPFSWSEIFRHFLDPKIYGFAAMFFLLVSSKINQRNEEETKIVSESRFDSIVIFFTYYVCQQLLVEV